MCAQHGDHPVVEADDATTRSRLRLRLVHLPRHGDPRPANRQDGFVEVNVGPAERGDLTSSEPGREEERPPRVGAIGGDALDVFLQLAPLKIDQIPRTAIICCLFNLVMCYAWGYVVLPVTENGHVTLVQVPSGVGINIFVRGCN